MGYDTDHDGNPGAAASVRQPWVRPTVELLDLVETEAGAAGTPEYGLFS